MSVTLVPGAARPQPAASPIPPPTVSVVLPNYNHANYIGKALSALAAQTRPADEILVIDDASTDESLAVVESFRLALPQLRILRNETNQGVCATLNRGIIEARGSHVVSSAADDWLEPQFMAQLTAAASSYPEGRLCVSSYVQYYEAEDRFVRHERNSEHGPWYASDQPRYFSPEEFRGLLKRGFVWLPMNASLIERQALLDIGGYDARLRWHADWFLNYTLAFRHGFTIVPEALSVFRVGAESYSGRGMRNPQLQRQVCGAILDKLSELQFVDVREALRRHPVALSTFFRPLVQALVTRPREWPYLGSLAGWWFNEVAHGRRPRVLRDLTAKFGCPPYSKKAKA
ncbi:MAG TPA: glycosyltransferase family A protein [Stellaceae bacterium]|nr:glycosyltransferase family A protein [Stellaceae bacterium]